VSEFDGGVNVLQKIDKNFKVIWTDHKNIINISLPTVGFEGFIVQSVGLKITQKKVSTRGGHFSTWRFHGFEDSAYH